MSDKDDTSVKVAVRVRPQNAKEQVDMCRVCTFITPGEPQIVLGRDKAFTYDYVFDIGTEQQGLYTSCVEELVEGCFNGLNATVLAYGQTGSGKTYTMGTGFDVTVLPEEQGAVPRAVHHIFTGINNRTQPSSPSPSPQFELTAQFLELYNEEIIDLFDPSREPSGNSNKKLRIHETNDGNIYVDGAVVHPIKSEEETLEALKRGALSRSVGSTNMNAQSSRSHAIFTINLIQRRPIMQNTNDTGGGTSSEVVDWETLTAKFHFVDLAGSERLKRTGATGERAKEGISINCGLLALGNVISALGDKAKRGCHVPYRDSKLTRLLQDSLGGNSQTLMIACVSPSDRDFMETLNTLKYANRARNIKNKVSVNQDKASAQMAALHKRIQELELQINEFKSGRLVVTDTGSVVVNDLSNENTMLKAENDRLRLRMKTMQSIIDSQSERLALLQSEKDMRALGSCPDESTGQVEPGSEAPPTTTSPQVQSMIQQYVQQIEELRSQLLLTRSQQEQSHDTPAPLSRQRTRAPPPELMANELLQTARNNITKLEHHLSSKVVHDSGKSVRWKRKRRVRKRDRSTSLDRMSSTDVEAWVLRSKSETNLQHSTTTTTGNKDTNSHQQTLNESDTEMNDEDDSKSEEEDEDEEREGNEEEDEEEEEEDSDMDPVPLNWSSDSSGDDDTNNNTDPLDDTASIATSIAELTTEINIKQQLVDQLEKAQRSLQSLRSQYEEKMAILQMQIRSTEAERDKMIKNLTSSRQSEAQEEKIKELRDKYETQLNQMRQELKHLQIAKKEHAVAVKKNIQQDGELRKLRSDLSHMKTQKVDLIKQLKKETSVFRMNDQKKEKEIAKLRKDHRRKENLIKSLQADARRKEMVLKRKNEEVQALRRQQSNKLEPKQQLAPPTPYRVGGVKTNGPAAKKARLQRRQSSVFSCDGAKKKWRNMEILIKEVVNRHQTMNIFETDLDRWLQKREELSHRSDQLRLQRETLLQATEDPEVLSSVEDELEALTAQINWTNDSIDKLQEEIVVFEDTKADSDTMATTALIHTCSTREAKYLLEHLVNMAIELGTQAFQKDTEVKSLKMRLVTSEQHAELIKMYSSPHLPQSPYVINSRTVSKIGKAPLISQTTPTSLFPAFTQCNPDSAHQLASTHQLNEEVDLDKTIVLSERNDENTHFIDLQHQSQVEDMDQSFVKYRRRTAVPTEIKEGLNETKRHSSSNPLMSSSSINILSLESVEVLSSDQSDSAETVKVVPITTTTSTEVAAVSGDTTYNVLSSSDVNDVWMSSPPRRNSDSSSAASPRRGTFTKKRSAPSLTVNGSERNNTAAGGDKICPGSPSNNRANITRLSSLPETSTSNSSGNETKNSFEIERPSRANKHLICTHTVKGHSSGILSIAATDVLLFTGSQDCTAKVWDLSTGQSVAKLTGHHSYVRKVTFCPLSQVVFTACQSLVKVWDLRDLRKPLYMRTLYPPGSTGNYSSTFTSSADTVPIQDLLVHGNLLLAAAGSTVNVWDLRHLSAIGRLTGHTGSVGTMATINNDIIATGSRDRLIKLYDVSQLVDFEQGFTQLPQSTLSPAHYDTVTSLALFKDHLYSSCGISIKKWNIPQLMAAQAVDGAHPQTRGNSITSLSVLDSFSLLVSGCKSGCVKLWDTTSCQNIGEISTAHKSAINSLTVNRCSIFTGSSDKTVKIWKPNLSHSSSSS